MRKCPLCEKDFRPGKCPLCEKDFRQLKELSNESLKAKLAAYYKGINMMGMELERRKKEKNK